MHSHPPLTNMHDVTRQRAVITDFTEAPATEALVVLASPRAQQVGRRVELPRGDVTLQVGRDPQADVPVQSESVSRRHCRLRRDALGWSVEDVGSTNGTYLNEERITRATLRPGDQLRVGDTVFKFLGGDVEGAIIDRMLREALRDPLTNAYTRGHFTAEAESCLHELRGGQRRATLLVLDLDHFKSINDRWGHVCGDAVLRETSARVTRVLPEDAVFARLGGEEFAVLLPSFGAASARLVAERLRVALASSPVVCGDVVVDVTCSVGLSEAGWSTGDVEGWLRAADDLLYEAKRGGRNRVEG